MSSLLKIKIPSYMDTQQQASSHPMELQQQGHKKASSFPATPTKQSKPTFQHQRGQTDQQQGSQTPSTPTKQNFPKNRGQMKTTPYTPYTPYTPPFSMRIVIPQQRIKQGQMMRMSPPTTPNTPPTPFYPFGRSQMSSQEVKKTPPNPRKVKFDASLPQDQTKKTKTQLKRHRMSADDKSNFYSKSNIKKMQVKSKNAVPTMIQFFKNRLETRYKKSVVRQIMSVLNAKVEQKVKTKRDEVFNLDLQQARKFFLEEIIMEEMQNMASGKPLTLLPKASQIYPNHVTVKNPTYLTYNIPIEEGVTYGMIKIIYASLIGIDDPSRIVFLKDGNLIQDTYYTDSCIINAMVK